MRGRILTLVVLGVMLIVFACCAPMPSHKPKITKPILFQIAFINQAWEYTNLGWIIDSDGKIFRYLVSKENSDRWHEPADGILSETDMDANLSFLMSVVDSIDKQTLTEMAALIESADSGHLTPGEQAGNDMGEKTYCGYIWDRDKKIYKQVVFEVWGDFCSYNTSEEAETLAGWLKQLQSDIVPLQ